MSALARFIVGVTSLIAPRDKVSTISSQRGFSNSNITVNTSNCYPTSADTACNTELNGQIRSHRSSKLKIDTERGNISCSPALLEFSFDSGIGMGSSSFTGNVSVVDEKLTSKTENSKTLKSGTDIIGTDIDSVSGNDAVDFNGKLATFVSIDNGISKYSKEEISWKLRYERLQQCRLILFALDRQQTQYRQLRERLSKIGEGRFAKKEPVIDNICNVCSCPINIIDSKSFITCFVCKKRICHATKCSNFVPKSGRRECQICHFSKDSLTHTQSWITEQMFFSRQNHSYPVRARSEIYIPIQDYNEGSTNFESVSQVGANCFAITSDQKTKIREYVEEVVAKLLGNSLDQIRVTQLSKSENYLPGILNNHVIHQHPVGLNDNQTKENILSEFSEISQARLRNMVESIIAEMLGTSGLTNVNVSEPELNTNTYGNGRSQLSHRHRTEHSFEPKAYQDFLAKAVLNKIADNEGYIRKLSESTPDLSSCNIDINFNMDDRSISPESSLETTSPFNYTDAQHSSKIIKDLDRESTINDYIASHTVPLPDLSTPMTDYEEDDMASVSSSILVEGNWEDNWLFRKKRPSLTTSITGSVGMLVPAPKDDVRAQIGDKTTDEISDLSEIDSDTDDSVQICAGLDPYNDRIVNKHLIGGQNTKVILDELIETASLISNTSHSPNEANYIETRNDHIVEKSLKTEAFNSKVANHSPLELKISSKSMPTSCYEAHTAQESENNPISAPLQATESIEVDESCTGFSSVEIFEEPGLSHDTRSICQGTSVIEILAAITLAPLLAVPASEQPSIQAPFEMNAIKELSDLALAEIKLRIPELSHHSLDIIDEEEETKVINSLEINESCSEKCVPLSDIRENMNSPLIPNAITNLADENDLHELANKICAETHSPDITKVLLPSSLERTSFEDSNRSNITQLPELKTYSIEEPSNVILLHSEAESQLSSKPIIRCSSHEEPFETIYSLEKEIPKISTEAVIGIVKETKGILSSEATQSFEFEKQVPYNETRDEPESETPADNSIDTDTVKLNESENQYTSNEPKIERNINAKNKNEKHYIEYTDERNNEADTKESSETPDTHIPDKQEPISESTGECIMDKQAIAFSVTDNGTQNPCSEPEVETVMGTECENPTPFTHQVEKCATEKEVPESSQTLYILVTDKLQSVCELPGDKNMDTEAGELSEIEKQIACNEPEIECAKYAQSENKISYIDHKNEYDNEVETQESSESPDTHIPDKQEPIRSSTEESIMNTELVELSVTENRIQNPCTEPEVETVMGTECENPTPSTHQVEKCTTDHKNEHDNEVETQESSETPDTHIPDKQEPIRSSTEESIMNTELVELSVTENRIQNPCTEPEVETVMSTECETPTPSTHQVEKCTTEIEVSESSQTSYILATDKQQSVCELKGDRNMDTEAVELSKSEKQVACNEPEKKCAKDAQNANEMSYIHHKNEHDNEVETQESSETPDTPMPDKQEPIRASTEESIMNTEVVELSVTENGIQNPCTEPEVETVMGTECENPTPSTHQVEKCATEKEVSESSQTLHILTTEKQQSVCELQGDRNMDTEAVELSKSEKQVACNEPEIKCAKDAQNANEMSYIHHKNEHDNEVETQESSETPDTPIPDKQEPIRASTEESIMNTEVVELSVTENRIQNPCTEPEVETVMGTECENPTPSTHQVEKCTTDHKNEHDNEVETQESSETPDTHIPDKQEPIRASTEESIVNTEVVELSVTDNGTQNPCSEPEVETVMGTECENPTPSTHQVEKCATEKEVSESSQTLHISATDKQQSVCELQGDRNMDTEAVELSEIEKQVACNEPEIECAKDAQNANEMSYIHHKNEHDNEVETQESSETPDTPMPDKQEPIRASTEESIMNTEVVELSVTENRIQNPCTEPEVETVMGTECENPTPSTHQVEKCATEKEVSESSQTLHILTTEKQQSVCELQGDRNMDTEAVELSKSEKQVACNEPEIKCAKDAQNANEMSYIHHKNEHDNEVETQESSETPDTPIPDKQEPIRESTGECIMDKQAIAFSVTDNGTQDLCTEPEVETVMRTECESPTPSTHRVEKCAIEKEVSESSQTSYILATDKLQSVCELPGDKNMDTEAGELSEIENQIACNEPEIECAKYAQSENKISYIDQKNEHDNKVKTQESSETPDTPIPDKQEPIRSSTEERIMNTEVVEFSVTDNGTQNPCSEPEVETVMGTECENPTPSTHQVEKCATEKEVSESSQMSYISATDKQQSVCELQGDRNMDTEAVELSEIEKQVACNDPEIKCAKDAQNANEMSYIHHKNEHDNEVETQESSETPNTPIPDKQEPISESTGECIMDKEAIAFSVTDNGTQDLCTEPEVETVMRTECESPTPSTHRVEKCAIEKEVSESSQTSYILATDKLQSVCELPGDKNMDTEAGELSEIEKQIACNEPEIECAKDAQNANEMSYTYHKNEHDNEVETQESSETPDTPIPDKQEPISESTGECIMDKQAIAFSVTDNGTQDLCTEPEVETVMRTECESPTPSTHQVEKCAIEKEVSESSQTLHILTTEKQQSVCELPGDKNMDTGAGELSENEKQIARNKPEIECVKDAQSENGISYIDHKNELDNEVETQESSETPDTPIPDKQEPICESTGECIMDKHAIAFSVTDNGTQNPCTEPEVEIVMGTECENPTPSTHQVEKCAIEKEVSESSQTSYILATDKLQSVCELPGDKNMDTEAGELSEIEKQIVCNEPEIECAKDAQNANEMSYTYHKNEHDNEVETQESSETPDTPIPDKQEPISESTGECIMDKQAIAFSVTDNETQNPCTEPEVETVKGTECEDPTPFTHQVEKCAIEKQVSESSQTSYILATEEQQSSCELPGDRHMDKEAVELSESEKQIACNEPEIDCSNHAPSANEMSYIDHKNEHDNEVDTQESSETPYTPIPEKQEPISESTGECIMDKHAIAFSVTDNGTQNPCTEPEVETLMGTECENPTPSTHQVEKCATEKEVSESSQTLHILATEKQQSVCELPGDKNMDTEAGELSEIEKQIACNEPQIECAKDAQNANEMSYIDHKNEHDNEVETQESSETPDTPMPDKQEPVRASTGECIMNTEVVEFSVAQSGIQNPCTEPEVETVMGTECENPTPSTHQVEKCATEKEVSESSQTLHILATDKQQSVCELQGDRNMDTEAVELSRSEKQVACNEPEIECAKDAQNANEMSYIDHKNEHDNEVETQESSETPYNTIPEKQEPISESTVECIMDKHAIAFSVTDNGTQNPCTEPEVETVMGTECENPTPSTHQVEKCATEKEVSESSQTLHILATEKQQSVCELPGDKNMDTEAGELSEIEKQIACNEPQIECAKDAQNANEMSYIDHKNEHDNEVETQESSETPDTPMPDKQEPVRASTGECIMNTEVVEFSVAQSGIQNPCTEPEVETVMGTECENPTPSTHQVEKCATKKEVSESSQMSYILATVKQQSVCELQGDRNMDTEAVELSKSEKQVACNEPEIGCAKDAQNANEMSYINHKNEHDNEVETQESSETPDTPIPDKQEPIRASTGECIMNTEVVEFSVTDNGTQNNCSEPEAETIMGTECENPTSTTHQVEKCATEKEVSESSQMSYILATVKQQSVCELQGDRNMDTEAVELSKSEKQVACNEPEIECAKDAQNANEISYIDHKNEHDNEVETQESSETPDTHIPDTQEPISESKGECSMDKQAIAFSVTDNGTQNPCTEPEVETIKGTECGDPTPFTHQVEKCAIEQQVSESSQTSYILATEEQQSACELPGDRNMDKEAVELSESEKQIACNEPEIDCSNHAPSANEMSYIDHKNEHDNEVETQESSETLYTPKPEKQETINESTGKYIMDTQVVEFYVTDNGTQNPCTEPEVETVKGTECEDPTPFTHQVEKCAIEKQVSESSQTSYILATDEQQSACELPGDRNMDKEAVELSENEKQTGNGTQNLYTEPEVETVMGTECENSSPFRFQKEKCAKEKEVSESYTFATVKHEAVCDSPGDKIMDTEAVELTENEKLKPKGECSIDAQREIEIPYIEKEDERGNEVETQEPSETPYTFISEKQKTISESKEDKIIEAAAVEFFKTESVKQKPCNEPEKEVRTLFNGRKEECTNGTETHEYSDPLCISAVDMQENSSGPNRDNVINTGCAFRIPFRGQKEESANDNHTSVSKEDGVKDTVEDNKTEDQEFSKSSYSCENKNYETMSDAEVVELCASESEKQKPRKILEGRDITARISEKEEQKSDREIIKGYGNNMESARLPPQKGNPPFETKEVYVSYTDVLGSSETLQSYESKNHEIHSDSEKTFIMKLNALETPPIGQILDQKLRTTIESLTETNLTIKTGFSGDNLPHRQLYYSNLSLNVDRCKAMVEKLENNKTEETIENLKTSIAKNIMRDEPEDKSRLINTGITLTNDSSKSTGTVKNFLKVINVSESSNLFSTLNNDIISGTTFINYENTAGVVTETSDAKSSDLNTYPNKSSTVVVELLSGLNNPVAKQLGKQSHKIGVTSSDEKCSLRTMTYIAKMCKTLINDKRLLASLERRRRQTEIMQKYLHSIDSFEFEFEYDYLKQDLLKKQALILCTPPPPLPKCNIAATLSESLRDYRFNFLNDILFSDQLSSVTNLASRSTSTNIESCLAGHNNEQDIIHTNNCNNSFVNTTKLTNGSYPNSKSNFKQGQQFMYNNNSQEDNNGEEDDVVPLRHFVPGSIAEREYKKWNNAVEMPNNPYTPDALKRRISGSQERFIDLPNISSSTNKSVITVKAEDDEENESTSNIGYKRYSRDYYINADSTPKASPNHQNPRNDKRKRLCSGYSDELIEDTFTKESISQGNEIIAKETPVVIHPTVYLALPAQVVEESASFETLSNQSMNSANTTTSDDSDTIRIYDFKKQTTIIVHNDDKPSTTDITITTSDSVEPFPATTKCALTKDALARSKKIDEYKELYPREILLEAKPAETCVSTLASGPTPKAFKFLQPKRRLIDPSQVLPLEEEAPGLSFGEKAVVEEEVAQVMPSVKALAQAFLLSSNKCSQAEKRWKKGIQKMPSTAVKLNNPPTTQTENMVTAPEMTEDATIASDLSSLETDPSANMDILTNKTKTSSPERTANYEDNNNKNTTNMLRRVSMLKSNIAFFENLKFK